MATETKKTPADDSKTAPPPPPPSPPTSPPPSKSTGSAKVPLVDGRQYYGYLYNKDKTPTDLLDALLRAVGKYIVGPLRFSAPAPINAADVVAHAKP